MYVWNCLGGIFFKLLKQRPEFKPADIKWCWEEDVAMAKRVQNNKRYIIVFQNNCMDANASQLQHSGLDRCGPPVFQPLLRLKSCSNLAREKNQGEILQRANWTPLARAPLSTKNQLIRPPPNSFQFSDFKRHVQLLHSFLFRKTSRGGAGQNNREPQKRSRQYATPMSSVYELYLINSFHLFTFQIYIFQRKLLCFYVIIVIFCLFSNKQLEMQMGTAPERQVSSSSSSSTRPPARREHSRR